MKNSEFATNDENNGEYRWVITTNQKDNTLNIDTINLDGTPEGEHLDRLTQYIDIGAFIATMRPSDDQNMYSNFFLTLLWPFAILTIPGASLASFVKSKFHLD